MKLKLDDSSEGSELATGLIKNMPKITLCRTVPVLPTMNNSNGSKNENERDDDMKSESDSSKHSGLITGEMVSGHGAPKLVNNFTSDDNNDNTNTNTNNRFPLPKMSKASAGSMTAPVVGGSGEIYVMRGAYPKVSNKENTNKDNNTSTTKESFVDDTNSSKV